MLHERNKDLQAGDIVYYVINSVWANGFDSCKVLEKLDTQKHGYSMLSYYLVECHCHVDDFIDMKTNMQLYTKEQIDKLIGSEKTSKNQTKTIVPW